RFETCRNYIDPLSRKVERLVDMMRQISRQIAKEHVDGVSVRPRQPRERLVHAQHLLFEKKVSQARSDFVLTWYRARHLRRELDDRAKDVESRQNTAKVIAAENATPVVR